MSTRRRVGVLLRTLTRLDTVQELSLGTLAPVETPVTGSLPTGGRRGGCPGASRGEVGDVVYCSKGMGCTPVRSDTCG